MSKSLSLNVVDSGVSGVTTLVLDKSIINFGDDFRVKTQSANELILTNMTSPLGKDETYRLLVNPVKDIYKNAGIDPALYAASRRGVSVVNSLHSVYTVTESTTGVTYDLPVSGQVILKIPADTLITPAIIEDFLGRVLAGLYESGSATTDRLSAILRGSLKPIDL